MTDLLAEIKKAKPSSPYAPILGLSWSHIDWLVSEVERLQRFEAMWEDCRQHRDQAEARARRYMETVQQVVAIVVPDEEDAL